MCPRLLRCVPRCSGKAGFREGIAVPAAYWAVG
ncbi:hypothetical protein SRABI26_00585 [Arthrobacter sp. Bi26]|nr:hypothetical protein SRABI26_00585 [Arthrobacter sp. Bi26]